MSASSPEEVTTTTTTTTTTDSNPYEWVDEDYHNVPEDAPNKVVFGPDNKYVEIGPYVQIWRFGQNIPIYDYEHQTMYDGFMRSVNRVPNNEFLGERKIDPATNEYERKYTFITYAETNVLVEQMGSFLTAQNLHKGDMVGIFSRNCPQWIITQYGSYRQSLVPVPLYSTLGDNAIRFILDQCQLPVVVCAPKSIAALIRLAYEGPADANAAPASNAAAAAAAAPAAANKPSLRVVISTDSAPLASDVTEMAQKYNVRVLTWADALAEGAKQIVPAEPPTPEDLYGIIYTSGSTGTPKGAMITHKTAANAADIMYGAAQFSEKFAPNGGVEHWRYISYLPLAHSMELELTSIMITGGGTIGFNTTINNLFDDIEVLQASFFPTVPRVWKRFYDKVMEAINSSFITRTLYNIAYVHKKEALETGVPTWIDWDALIFNKIKSKLGPKMILSMCGAAPMDRALIEWVRITCDLVVYQVYGLTETFAGVCSQQLGYFKDVQSIGAPAGRTRIRLVDVPEMNYSVSDKPPRGELIIKGPTVFKGYYKEPEKTAESLSEDGWFSTGDCGRLNEDGTITIIDRKKNLFKLAQGEYVAAEMVEMVYGFALSVSQVWVWANSMDPFLVAVVVPSEEVVRPIAESQFGFAHDAKWTDICADPRINAYVLHEMQQVGRDRNLKGYEIVKGIILEPNEWGPTCDLLTPTLKFMRAKMAAHYAKQLDTLCSGIRGTSGAQSRPQAEAAPAKSSGGWFSWLGF